MGPAQQKVKIDQLAHYLYDLIVLFEKDDDIKRNEPYQLLERLLHEQCKIFSEKDVVEDTGIQLKTKTKGETLQSQHDLEITPELRLRDQMYSIQQTTAWKDRYSIRSGIEATLSELKRAHGIGRLRVRRAVKVCFAVACKSYSLQYKEMGKGPYRPSR